MIRIFKAMSVLCALVLAASVHAQETRFTVGVSLPLSGDAAECGVAVRNAITLAQEEISERLKHITFVYEDNRKGDTGRYDSNSGEVEASLLAASR